MNSAQFNLFDTVEITSTIDNKKHPVRGILLTHNDAFMKPYPFLDGIYVLKNFGKISIPIRMGFFCKMMPCRMVLYEKTLLTEKYITKIKRTNLGTSEKNGIINMMNTFYKI